MNLATRVIRVFRQLIKRRRTEHEIDEEFHAYFDLMVHDSIAAGMSPEAARRRARASCGHLHEVHQGVRRVRSEFMFDALWFDALSGFRALRARRAFASCAIVSLAIGIASTTTLYAVARAMLFEAPAGIRAPEQVFGLWLDERAQPGTLHRGFSYPQAQTLHQVQDVFSDLAWYRRQAAIVGIGDDSMTMNVEVVEGTYFDTLGVPMMIGRAIQPHDDQSGAPPVVVISNRLWRTRFGSRTDVLGESLRVGNALYTIIGVSSALYDGVHLDLTEFPQVWLPLHSPLVSAGSLTTRGTYMFVVARLREGADPAAAQSRLNAAVPAITEPADTYKSASILMVPASRARVQFRRERVATLLGTLAGVSGLVLLAACFNVANFLVGQAFQRRHEMAVRSALGATRGRLVRQLMTEALVLALLAMTVSLPLMLVLRRLLGLVPKIFGSVPLYAGVELDLAAIGVALVLALGCTLVFGVLPALMASPRNPWAMTKNRSAAWIRSGLRPSPRQLLLALQMGLALVLGITSVLYVRSLYNVARVEPGFDATNVTVARVSTQRVAPERQTTIDQDLLAAFRRIPGVQRVSFSDRMPSEGVNATYQVKASGVDSEFARVPARTVTPGYFGAIGSTVVAGRDFEESANDDKGAVIVNEEFAARRWPRESPLGKTLEIRTGSRESMRSIVGVVRQHNCNDHLLASEPCVYVSFDAIDPNVYRVKNLQIRTAGGAVSVDQLRQAGSAIDSQVLVYDVRTLEEHLANRIATYTFTAVATAVVAFLGLALAVIGCYAVFASVVSQSAREIAVHIVLGASPGRLLRSLVVGASTTWALGTAVSLPLAALVSRLIGDQLYKVNIGTIWPFALVALVLYVTAVIASAVPARRIAKLQPGEILKAM